MFRPLGLLDDLPCPDHAGGRCESQRTECPFDHSRPAPLPFAASKASAKSIAKASSAAQTAAGKAGTTQLLKDGRRTTALETQDSIARSAVGELRDGPREASSSSSSSSSKEAEGWSSAPVQYRARPSVSPAITSPISEEQHQQRSRMPNLSQDSNRAQGSVTGKRFERDHTISKELTTPQPVKRLKGSSPPTSSVSKIAGNSHAHQADVGGGPGAAYRRPPNLTLSSHPRTSPIPFSSRNTSLKTLWTVFTAAYAPLLDCGSSDVEQAGRQLAHEDTRQQELEVFSKASKASYRPSIVTTAVGVKKRDRQRLQMAVDEVVASWSSSLKTVDAIVSHLRSTCSEIGTTAAVQVKRDADEERIKTMISASTLHQAHFVCPREKLHLYGYDAMPPDGTSIDDAIGVVGGSEPTATGTKVDCIRCQKPFIVGPDQDGRACHYHWGKKFFERDPSSGERGRVQKWSCCGRSVDAGAGAGISLSAIASYGGGPTTNIEGDVTCGVGPHVFKEDGLSDLHKRQAFTTLQALQSSSDGVGVAAGESDSPGHLEMVALDCELGFTTAGMSLTRVTLINEQGATVLDELCKPRADIVDANVQFSGVPAESLLRPGVKSFEEVQAAVGRLIGPQSILIGHGLENDLRALRLLHDVVVDTAMLFPHPRGLPFRQKLKTLAYNHLGRTIQAGPVSEGHSSAEDAKASLDLVKWKLQKEPRTPFTPDAVVKLGARSMTSASPAAPASVRVGGTRVVSSGRMLNAGPTRVVEAAPRVVSVGSGPSKASTAPRTVPPRRPSEGAHAGRRPSESGGSAGGGSPTPSLFIPQRR
ncbi:unnamed protein product [Parajaminaea phylloscopi]